jgi:beta,beta-carotene 9',10'-dioxygenase
MNAPAYALGFRTQTAEVDRDDLPVSGKLPLWVRGVLLRTTPSQYEVGQAAYEHWFDGLAMLHRFAFEGGRVAYRSRMLRSGSYLDAKRDNTISRGEFATKPGIGRMRRLIRWLRPIYTDNGNVNVNRVAGSIAAFTETPRPLIIDPDRLTVVGQCSSPPNIRAALSTAHPHFDRERRSHYTYFLEFGARSRYHMVAVDAGTGEPKRIASVRTAQPSYLHSFGMTRQHLVLVEFPFVVNPLRLRFSGEAFIRNYRWQPALGTRFHVIDKDSGEIVRTAQGPACFAFHHVNAFTSGDDLYVDLVTFPDSSILDELYLDHLRSSPVTIPGTLTRFRIGPRGDAHDERLADAAFEFPRIHYEACAGKPYRYVYVASNQAPGNFLDTLVKRDLERGSDQVWSDADCYPGEPVFVREPGADGEDDGLILSVVLNVRSRTSFLLVLDASSFEEQARVQLPHPVAFGFHGNFFAGPDA